MAVGTLTDECSFYLTLSLLSGCELYVTPARYVCALYRFTISELAPDSFHWWIWSLVISIFLPIVRLLGLSHSTSNVVVFSFSNGLQISTPPLAFFYLFFLPIFFKIKYGFLSLFKTRDISLPQGIFQSYSKHAYWAIFALIYFISFGGEMWLFFPKVWCSSLSGLGWRHWKMLVVKLFMTARALLKQ